MVPDPLSEPEVAEIPVVPMLQLVASPLAAIVATDGFADDQIAVLVKS